MQVNLCLADRLLLQEHFHKTKDCIERGNEVYKDLPNMELLFCQSAAWVRCIWFDSS